MSEGGCQRGDVRGAMSEGQGNFLLVASGPAYLMICRMGSVQYPMSLALDLRRTVRLLVLCGRMCRFSNTNIWSKSGEKEPSFTAVLFTAPPT
eukprot:4509435-Pyramimonas_sp.AAC.1